MWGSICQDVAYTFSSPLWHFHFHILLSLSSSLPLLLCFVRSFVLFAQKLFKPIFRGLLSKLTWYTFHRYIINHKIHGIIFAFRIHIHIRIPAQWRLTPAHNHSLVFSSRYLFYAIPFPSQFLRRCEHGYGCKWGRARERRSKKKLEIACESKEQLEQKVSNIKKNEQKKVMRSKSK